MQLLSVSSKPRICMPCRHNRTKAAERSTHPCTASSATINSSFLPWRSRHSTMSEGFLMLTTLSAGLLHQIHSLVHICRAESRLRRRSLGLLADFFEGNIYKSDVLNTEYWQGTYVERRSQPYARWEIFKHVNSVAGGWRRLMIWQSPWYQRTGHKISSIRRWQDRYRDLSTVIRWHASFLDPVSSIPRASTKPLQQTNTENKAHY